MTTTLIAPRPHQPGHLSRRSTDQVDPAGWPPRPRQRGDRGDAVRPAGIPAGPPLPDAGHTGGPAQDEVPLELVERGLRRYTARVAAAVGADPAAAWCEWADAPSAYIALDHRLPGYPDRDAALIWAAERGWALAAEAGCGEDLLITDVLGGDVVAPPRTVARFTRTVLAGRCDTASLDITMADAEVAEAAGGTDLARRLAGWPRHESSVDGQND